MDIRLMRTADIPHVQQANITNLPWDVALKEVMNASGYDVSINPDGVIVIDTFENIAARQATIPLRNRTIRLNYARAKAVAPMVAETVISGTGSPAKVPTKVML